ncbi:unnamed protein product [Amaranthus hypochondriacus]
MGRRGRPPKVKAVPRKTCRSYSSREGSSSPERSLFHSSTPSSSLHNNGGNASIQPAIGLSWVSVLKSSMKQQVQPTRSPPVSVVQTAEGPPVPAQTPIPDMVHSSRKIAYQKKKPPQSHRVSEDEERKSVKPTSSDKQIEEPRVTAPISVDSHTLVLGQIDVDLRDTLATIQTNNPFAALNPSVERDKEDIIENTNGINALGAFPIHVND